MAISTLGTPQQISSSTHDLAVRAEELVKTYKGAPRPWTD